ncbi:MAG: gliding motility-associated C-terminal domain-containing protein [Bacteroidetes bacterium]|nr:MAG: gliding motility-associated C-terminal domain-containing protein [Bacteroidota bacterium]
MNSLRTIALCLLMPLLLFTANAQDYDWVKFYQGNFLQQPVCMSVDVAGNQYAAFNNSGGQIILDSQLINTKSLIVKQDSSGKTLWYQALVAPQNQWLFILSTNFTSNGNLLSLVSASTDIILGQDTLIGVRSNNTNRNIFVLEFNSSGQLLRSSCMLHARLNTWDYSGSGTHNRIVVDNQDNIYACIGHADTIIVRDSNGQQVLIPGLGQIQSVFKFSASGRQFNWRTSMPSTSNLFAHDLEVDQNGLVYLAGRHIYNPGSDSSILKSAGFTLANLAPPSIQNLGIVYVFGKNGNGKNWFRFRNGLCAVYNVVAHDSNSIFVSGLTRGDSLHTPSGSKALPVFGTYHFYGLYSLNGSEKWIRHEDTTTSASFTFNNQYGTATHYKDEFYYISYRSGHNFSIPVRYSGQSYAFPSTWFYAYGVTLKIDFRGDILWCIRTEQYPFTGMGTDQASNLYFQGSWSQDTIYFGSIVSPRANSIDAFIGKTFDYGIFRGEVSEGPYCAGDTLLVPYSLQGNYGDSNTFIAELSDEFGNFTGTERELGRLKSKVNDTIRGTLPLLQVASSHNYRIRVRSTHPQVQSFFRSDTLRLLVYSRDKADPGAADTICFGDTLQLNTYGGTKWTWSPARNMSDITLRQPLVWPDTNSVYQIIIDDSSGCGQADTAYKQVVVRDPLQLIASFSDTIVCPVDTIHLKLNASGGKSNQYTIAWFRKETNSTTFLSTHELEGSSDSLAVSGISGDTSGTAYLAILSDSCSEVQDSLTFIVKSYLPPQVQLPFSDTVLCLSNTFQVAAMATQGRPSSYHYHWDYDASPFGGSMAQISLDSLPRLNGILKVRLSDACHAGYDSAQMQVRYFQALQANMAEQGNVLRDTGLCPNARLLLANAFPDTGSGPVQYYWIWGQDTIAQQAYIHLDADSLRAAYPVPADSLLTAYLKLVLENQCETVVDSVSIRLFHYPIAPLKNASINVLDSINLTVDFEALAYPNLAQMRIHRDQGGILQPMDTLLYEAKSYSLSDTFTLNGDWPCYVVEVFDSCGNSVQYPSLCIQELAGIGQQLQNTLFWKLDSTYRAERMWLWNGLGWDSLTSLNAFDTSYAHQQLACNTTYRYRLSYLTTNGQRYFTNSLYLSPFDTIAPQAPTIVHVRVNPSQQIQLHWNRSVDDDVTEYEIWRDRGSGLQWVQIVQDTQFIDLTNHPDSLPPSYAVISVDSCGIANRSDYSDTVKHFRISLETGDCEPLVKVRWETYRHASSPDQYVIYRSTDGITFTAIDSGLFSSGLYHDSSVLDKVWYAYKVEARFDQNTYRVPSDTDAIQAFVFPVSAMAKMDKVTVANSGTAGAMDLHWMKWDMNDSFARGYYIWYLNGANPSLLHTETDLNTTYFQHQPVDVLTSTHAYAVSTYNLCPDDSSGLFHQSEVSDSHQSILLHVGHGNLKADLNWTAYQGFVVDEYEVWRSENNGPEYLFAQIPASDTLYSDSVLSCGRLYAYRVLAKEKMGTHSSWSNSVEHLAFDTVAPVGGKVLNATILASDNNMGALELELEGSQEHNANQVYVYRILSNGSEVFIDSLPNFIGSLQTQLVNLNTLNETFSYRIRISDSCGNQSAYSDSFSLVHLRAEAINNAVQLNWTPIHGYEAWHYLVQREDGIGNWLTLASLDSTNLAFTDSKVRCTQVYTYRILAEDALLNYTSASNIATDTAFSTDLPELPDLKFVTVSATGTSGKIQAEWQADSTNITAYHLEVSTDNMNWVFAYSGLNHGNETTNLNTVTRPYYFRLRSEDSCGNFSASYSPVHRSMHLQATAGEEKVNLNWTAYLGRTVQNYAIYRDGQLLINLPSTATHYSDSGLVCLNQYEYRVEALLDSNFLSQSNLSIAKPFDSKAPDRPEIELISVKKANELLELSWNPVINFDLAGYEINSFPPGSAAIQVADPLQLSLELPWSPDQSACYQIRSYDSCGNRSVASTAACVVLLDAKAEPSQNRVEWTPYTYFHNGLSHYELYVSDDTMNWELVTTLAPSITSYIHTNPDTTKSSFVYQVRAISSDVTPLVSYSTVEALVQSPIVWVPTAFSPGQSIGLNDVFKPEGAWLSNYRLQVWNRWGQLIYDGENQGWDGTYLGSPAMEGIYLYSMTIIGLDASRHYRKGTVTVYY